MQDRLQRKAQNGSGAASAPPLAGSAITPPVARRLKLPGLDGVRGIARRGRSAAPPTASDPGRRRRAASERQPGPGATAAERAAAGPRAGADRRAGAGSCADPPLPRSRRPAPVARRHRRREREAAPDDPPAAAPLPRPDAPTRARPADAPPSGAPAAAAPPVPSPPPVPGRRSPRRPPPPRPAAAAGTPAGKRRARPHSRSSLVGLLAAAGIGVGVGWLLFDDGDDSVPAPIAPTVVVSEAGRGAATTTRRHRPRLSRASRR